MASCNYLVKLFNPLSRQYCSPFHKHSVSMNVTLGVDFWPCIGLNLETINLILPV